jgi:hypothetical protein
MRATRLIATCAAIVLAWSMPSPSIAEPSCMATIDPSTGSVGDLLLSVVGPPERAVAVGMHFVGGDGRPMLAERVAGSWHDIPVPTEPGARTIELQDAYADGARVWVVGAFRNDRPQAGLFHGGRWFWNHPIDPGDGEDEFLGVATGPDGTVWAVGKDQVGANYQPLVERFDGVAWSLVPVPHMQGSAVLKDVTPAPDGRLYAVGWRVLPGGRTVPLVMATVGERWVDQEVPGGGLLSGVAVEPSGRPIAVGWRPTPDGDRTIALQRVGSGWRPVRGSGEESGRLTAVTSGGATVAVGTRFDDGVPVPTVERLTEHGWEPVEVGGEQAPESGGDQLLGVTGEAGSFLAVGIRDATEAFASLVATGECRS